MLNFGLWSSSKGMVRVPDLINLTRQEAIASIQNAGLVHSGDSSTTTQNINLNNRVSLQSVNANDLVQYESEISFIYYNYVEVTTTTTTTPTPTTTPPITDPTNPTTGSTNPTTGTTPTPTTTPEDCDYVDAPTYCLNVDSQGYGDLYQRSWTAGCPDVFRGRSFCGVPATTTQATTQATQATTAGCVYNGQITIVPCGNNNCVYSNCGEFLGYTST